MSLPKRHDIHQHHPGQDKRSSSNNRRQISDRNEEEEKLIVRYLYEVKQKSNEEMEKTEKAIGKIEEDYRVLEKVEAAKDSIAEKFKEILLMCKKEEMKIANQYIQSWKRVQSCETKLHKASGDQSASVRTVKNIKEFRDRVLDKEGELIRNKNRALSSLLKEKHWGLTGTVLGNDTSFIAVQSVEMQIRALETDCILSQIQSDIMSRLRKLEEENSGMKRKLERLESGNKDNQEDTDSKQ